MKKHQHDIKYITVQPLEVVSKEPGQSHSKFMKARKVVELNWIKKLQTVYPLGLNDNIMGIGNISKTNSVNIMDIVSKPLRNKRSHGRRVNRNKRKLHSVNTNISDLITISKNNGRHQLLSRLCSLSATKLHNIFEECKTISYFSPKYETVQIIIAFCYFKLFPKIDSPNVHKKYFLKIKYIDKGIDFINIASILNDSVVKEKIPGYFENTELPTICYIYKKPSRQYVFNYSKICKDVNISNSVPDS